MNKYFFKLALQTLVWSCGLGIAVAEDWPRWMGPQMDGVWRESGIIKSIPESGVPIAWRQPLGPGYSGPAVANGRLFITDRTADDGAGGAVENDIRKHGAIPGGERVLCLNTNDGSIVWQHQYDCPYKIAYPLGPRCTPTVDGERVYTLGAMGRLICFEASSGKVVWERELTTDYGAKPPPWGYASHPLVDGELLIVPVGGEGSAIVAFNKLDGQEVWRALTSTDVAYAPLIIYENEGVRQLVSWHGDGIDSLNLVNGEVYWHVTFPDEKAQAAATSIVTPKVVGNRFFISEYYKGSLLLEIASQPPGVKEVYRTHVDDPRHENSLNALMTTPLYKDGLVYGVTGDGVMRCVRLDDGQKVWDNPTWLGKKPAAFATVFIVENDNQCILMCDNGQLMMGRFTPEGFESLGQMQLLEATSVARGRKVVWSHPAFANGHMFARNDKEIISADLRETKAQN